MTQKKYQRGIIHSSEKIKKLIDYRINDITAISNQSVSDILEKAILDGLFPRNKVARSIVFDYLYSDSEKNGVKKTIQHLFFWNSTGNDLEAKYDNFRPLVEYCLVHVLNSCLLIDDNFGIDYFLRRFGSFVTNLENCSKNIEDPVMEAMLRQRAEWARMLYHNACDKPEKTWLKFFLEVINDNWSLVSNWSITYQCLSDIVLMADFTETTQARYDLLEIIEQVSDEW